MTETMTTPRINDCEGKPIELDAEVDGGNGTVGKVVQIDSSTEVPGTWAVWVEWPDADAAEEFPALADYRARALKCKDLQLVP